MKKTLLFAAAVLALAACSKESPVKEDSAIDASKIVFNIDVQNADATKAIKTIWEDGDDVYVFFEDNFSQYVKMTYDGTSWTYKDNADQTTFTGLTLVASGKKLSAVYMPDFVCSAAPTYDSGNSRWTFGSVAGYYQSAASVDYTVTITDDVTTLKATISLKAPANIMQFYVPSSEVSAPGTGNEYVLTATHVINYTFDGIAPGGAVTQSNKANGFPLTAYEGTIGSDAGYYFWGILEGTGTYTYDFQLVNRNAEKKYAISSYSASKAPGVSIASAAFKLSDLTDNGNFVSLGYTGGPLWATGNLGRQDNSAAISSTNYKIVDPLVAGDYFQWGATVVYNTSTYNDQWTGTTYEDGLLPKAQDVAYQVNNSWRIPTKDQFDALINNTNTSTEWVAGWTNLGSTKGGRLITSKANGISLFFAAAGFYLSGSLYCAGGYGRYWSSTPDGSDYAYSLYFFSGYIDASYNDRYDGYSVRPVHN
ncbi:MAG: hypothetical protein IJV63_02990 [Bacteroidales bacterium]|nr:hypothetical protein [Bacteroidales bacterium]MBQ9701938.1 hypothetical protein [Bacteroidales bacterium]